MNNETFTFTETDLGAAIQGLRKALGRSPEVMAQIVGCTVPAYEKWEDGSLIPTGEWLIRLLQLCPDEETRNAFRIRSERRRGTREPMTTALERTVPLSFEERRQAWQAAREAIDLMYQCAEEGVENADRRLIDFAENLQGAARHYAALLREVRDR